MKALCRHLVVTVVALSGWMADRGVVWSNTRRPAMPTPIALPVSQSRLANGLTLVLHEDHRVPQVSVEVRYGVGSAEDPPGRSGFAHLFEHIMLQGSKHVPEDMGLRYLEDAGATERNGNTSSDFTRFHETLPSNELALALWIESDRMGFLLDNLTDQTFQNQRDVVKAELRQTFESVPYGWEMPIVYEHIYPPSHPYHRPIIGKAADLDAATLEDVRTFFRTWYGPNNAVLTIAGDVDAVRARALVDEYFGPILARPAPPRTVPTPVVLGGEIVVDVAADVELPRLIVAWPTAPGWSADDADVQLASRLLSTEHASRLHRQLVERDRLAQSVDAGQWSARLSSIFFVKATARRGHTTDELLAAIDEQIAKLGSEGPSQEEIARLQDATRSAWFVFRAELGRERAAMFGEYSLMTGRADFLAQDMARFDAATPESVRRSVVRFLRKSARVVERIVPMRGAPIAGEVRSVSTREAAP
jgi:zinc protease